jgi:hypothetical protein
MPPSTPFRPPRSAHAPALECAAGEKRAPPQNSPQAASKSAYGTVSSAAAASPGAARVKKLKDECEQLMMQLGCVHVLLSLRFENLFLTLRRLFVLQRSGSRPPVCLRRVGPLFQLRKRRVHAVAHPFVSPDAGLPRTRKRSAKYVTID